jgi:15-cis-phytoene synthase
MHKPGGELDVAASYLWCQQVCRESKSSFFSSFALLDPPKRKAMYALYAFARITDDISDNAEPAATREANLEVWRAQTAAMLTTRKRASAQSTWPSLAVYAGLWPALSDCVELFGIPHQLLDEIIAGVMLDIDHQQPKNWAELNNYCYHVASTVGLACTHIWRAAETLPTQSAVDCGIAFQLTNILRDIAEDAARGRIYIPQEILERHQIDAPSWLAGKPEGNWIAAVDEVAEEARRLYANGWSTIESLTPRCQRMFSLMWRGYRTLLDQILVEKQTLWHTKPRLPKATELKLLAQHVVPSVFERLDSPI